MMIRCIFLSIFIFCCTASCNTTENKKAKAKELYNNATTLVTRSYKESMDSIEERSSLIKANKLLNEAIALDSTYFESYRTKVQVLGYLGKNNEAIEFIDTVISIFPEELAIRQYQAILYDKVGKHQLAITVYNWLINKYDQKIAKDPENLGLYTDKIYTLAVSGNKDAAFALIDKLLKKYPNNSMLLSSKENLKLIDKEELLELHSR